MMPRLKAEEQLTRIEATALAMGHYDKGTVRTKMRTLRDAATGDRRRRSVKATPAQLGMVGIGVRMLAAPEKRPLSDV
ncbi:MAG: hypothetical protein HEQ22_03430 [Sphingopyxis sp.]|uniref:hypothetical protein n=1 Tax=Sphingopyxis sp. TaxID=1908224 RepID=UPI003D80D5CD